MREAEKPIGSLRSVPNEPTRFIRGSSKFGASDLISG